MQATQEFLKQLLNEHKDWQLCNDKIVVNIIDENQQKITLFYLSQEIPPKLAKEIKKYNTYFIIYSSPEHWNENFNTQSNDRNYYYNSPEELELLLNYLYKNKDNFYETHLSDALNSETIIY